MRKPDLTFIFFLLFGSPFLNIDRILLYSLQYI